MIIKKIKAKNVFCFDELELVIKYPIVQIIGNNLDEKKTSENDTDLYTQGNGVGKTSIYHIITEALYSKNINNIKKSFVANIYKQDPWSIELWVDDLYLKYNNTQCILYKNENILVRGRKEVTDYFENIIPFQLFTALTYISPKQHIPYFTDTDKYKKEFLQLLFKDLYKYLQFHPIITEEYKKVQAEIVNVNNILETNKQYIPTDIPDYIELIQIDYTELNKIKQDIETLKTEIINLEKQQVKYEEYLKQQEHKNKEIQQLQNKLKTFNIEKGDVTEIIEKLQLELQDLTTKKSTLENSIKNKICKLCGSVKDTSVFEKELNELIPLITDKTKIYNELKVYHQQYLEYKNTKLLLDKLTEVNTTIEVLPIDKTELENKKFMLQSLQQNSLKIEKQIKEKLEFNKQAEINNKLREKLLMDKEKAEAQIRKAEETLKELNQRSYDLGLLAKLFGPNGIFKLKLPERLQLLNQIVNKELAYFTNQFQLEFYLNNDKVTEKLLKFSKEYPIENCSTGEYTRIVLALLFATRNLLKGLYNISCNILFIDEIFGSLDAVGRALLLDYVVSKDFNTFLVSHSYLNQKYPVLEITKKKGVSTVKFFEGLYD